MGIARLIPASVNSGLSQTFFDRYANCARPQHSLTFGCGFGFHPVRFLFQVESSWARQSANSPKTAREKTLRQAPSRQPRSKTSDQTHAGPAERSPVINREPKNFAAGPFSVPVLMSANGRGKRMTASRSCRARLRATTDRGDRMSGRDASAFLDIAEG